MLTSIRGLLAATILAGSALAAAPAFAQDQAPISGITVSGNVAVVSDYRFRGVSMSGGDPAIQGGVDIAHDSGFYVGTWGSSIDGGGGPYGEMELDVYGGWSGDVTPGVTLDVGLLYYLYPAGDDIGGVDVPTDYFEPYASVSTTLGPVSAKLGAAYAWEQNALGGDDNLYVYTDWSLGIPNTPVTIDAHLGYTDGVLAPPYVAGSADDSGLDWSIGASMPVYGNLTAGVSYVGVEGPSVKGFTDDAVVATLSFSM
jgi:uncharacterized protein (TIGR02001 family)